MQKALFPISKTWITQEMNVRSHKGTKAIDFGVLLPYKVTELTAPFDGTILHVDPQNKGGSIAFQSDNKVKYADGSEDYMTLWTGHDNNPPKIGTKFKQGQVYSHMGTAGGVPKHCHLEVQRGKFIMPTNYIKNNYGNVYKLDNAVTPYKALFVKKDDLIKYSKYTWIREDDCNLNVNDVERNENIPQIMVIVSNLRIRSNPTLNSNVLGYAKKNGIYNDLETYNDSIYIWHKIADNQWIADDGNWLKLLTVLDYKQLYKAEIDKLDKIKMYLSQIEKIIEEI